MKPRESSRFPFVLPTLKSGVPLKFTLASTSSSKHLKKIKLKVVPHSRLRTKIQILNSRNKDFGKKTKPKQKQDTKATTEPTKSRLDFILSIPLVELGRHSVTQLFYSSQVIPYC